MENPKIVNKFIFYANVLLAVASVVVSLIVWSLYPIFIYLTTLVLILMISIMTAVVFMPLLFLLSTLFEKKRRSKSSGRDTPLS